MKFKNLFQRIFIDGLGGMGLGLFATLIIGTIIQQVGTLIGGTVGSTLFLLGKIAAAMTGAGIGVGVAYKFKESPLVVVSAATAGMVGAFAGNIAKYSMPNTRVYIDISADEKFASVALKNLANYEMNFKEDEILQRFTRGDAARTGEGSGLGLAIADSFVAASNGSFQVTVDGDLFKATVRLPLAEEAPPAVQATL